MLAVTEVRDDRDGDGDSRTKRARSVERVRMMIELMSFIAMR